MVVIQNTNLPIESSPGLYQDRLDGVLMQDGLSPTTPSGGLVNGACGYEQLSQQDWPFWDVVSIGPNNPIAYKGNKKGCGYCIQASCQGSVRPHLWLQHSSMHIYKLAGTSGHLEMALGY